MSNKSNPITDALCREALRRSSKSLLRSYTNGDDITARENMSIVSLFGGIALANAKLGGVHGFAGVLGGMFPGSPHGSICAALLPHVIEINIKALQLRDPDGFFLKRFEEASQIVTNMINATPTDMVEWIKNLCKDMNIPTLRSYGVLQEHFSIIAEKSASSSSMLGNPIKLTEEELLEVLMKSL